MDLPELDRLLAEATQGPWHVEQGSAPHKWRLLYESENDSGGIQWLPLSHRPSGTESDEYSEANSALIAALRNAAPELLAAARERDDWRRAAESQNRQWSQKCTEATELRASLEEARDCAQEGVCVLSPGCQRHWEERNRELVAERDAARAEVARLTAMDQPTRERASAANWEAWKRETAARDEAIAHIQGVLAAGNVVGSLGAEDEPFDMLRAFLARCGR